MSQSSKRNYTTSQSSHPGADQDLAFALNKIYDSIITAKAEVLFKLVPYLPKELQTLRGIGKILGVSYETVRNWQTKHNEKSLDQKGVDLHV